MTHVEPFSASDDGGVERGSVLLEINREQVRSIADVRRIVQGAKPGDVLAFYLLSPDLGRQIKTIRVE